MKKRLVGSVLALLLGVASAQGEAPRNWKWARVSVDLPVSAALFPAGEGSDRADAHCLICHSAEMVLSQPALTQDEWTAEVKKMREVYGAPLPAEQIEAVARYLHGINGR